MIVPAALAMGVLLFRVWEPILFAVGDFLVIQALLEPAEVIHVIAVRMTAPITPSSFTNRAMVM